MKERLCLFASKRMDRVHMADGYESAVQLWDCPCCRKVCSSLNSDNRLLGETLHVTTSHDRDSARNKIDPIILQSPEGTSHDLKLLD